MSDSSLIFSFDVGHSSIGWGVIKSDRQPGTDPEVVDCGVVLFQKDSCLASKRRQFRRTRRNIRATRQRIARLRQFMGSRGIVPFERMNEQGHPAPFFLASRFLAKGEVLSAEELWHVLRWYAHNRGYDGNSRWARDEEDSEDSEKQKNAIALMEKYGTLTMAESVTAILGLDVDDAEPYFHLETPAYRTANAAFPRRVVTDEVMRIMRGHIGVIPGLDEEAVRLIATPEALTDNDRTVLAGAGVREMPRRYFGGLLFGQLIPRFDNRIIELCPVTWARVYDEQSANGATEAEAKRAAEKFAKVPSCRSASFLRYRLARVIANIRADGKPLPAVARKELFELAQKEGRLTPRDLQQAVKAHCGDADSNVSRFFELHPDSREALVLDPVADFARKAQEVSQNRLNPFYPMFSDSLKRWCKSRWSKGKNVTLAECLARMEKHGEDTAELRHTMETVALQTGRGGKRLYDSVEELAKTPFGLKPMSGRTPYSRVVMEQVVDEVLAGYDPTRPAKSERCPDGEEKEADGVLYALLDSGSRVTELMNLRTMDGLTNNHLVRHRMLVLSRLVDEMVEKYAGGDPSRVGRAIVEVGREVSQFSGMTAKQIQAELNYRLRDFKEAVEYLQDKAPHLKLTGGLIRKCRIAMDMGWMCPFTSYKYDASDLPRLEREHIVPHAHVKTNALHALVLTLPGVNRMKGKRTAWQFIQEDANKAVPGDMNLTIVTPNIYRKLVEGLPLRGHKDDRRRQEARKRLMMVEKMDRGDECELGFTPGQLTQSSHLMKLAARTLRLALPEAVVSHIPGAVNAELRKSWKTMDCLVGVAPDVVGEDGRIRPKEEVRKITHTHHALDALMLAVSWHYVPGYQNGRLWLSLLKRHKNDEDKRVIKPYSLIRVNDSETVILDIPKVVKDRMRECLARERVMQHIPADRSGAITAETTWRILKIEGDGDDAVATLRQSSSTVENGKRTRKPKDPVEVGVQKVLGARSGEGSKLGRIKGGIMVEGNYGIALDPEPKMIVHLKVQQQLEEIAHHHGGRMPRVIRPYSLIKLSGQGERDGIWIVRSLKNDRKKGLLLDLTRPSFVEIKSKHKKVWLSVLVKSLLKKGLELMPTSYLGYVQQN